MFHSIISVFPVWSSIWLPFFKSFFNLYYISIDFNVGKEIKKKKERLLICWGLSSSWCINWKRPNGKCLPKAKHVFLLNSACWKHTSSTAASNRGFGAKSNESAILSKLYHVVHLESKAKIFYSSLCHPKNLNVSVAFNAGSQSIEAQRSVNRELSMKIPSNISLRFPEDSLFLKRMIHLATLKR